MRTRLSRVTTLAFTAILFAGGCGEGPTGIVTELQAPEFAKGGKPGKPMETKPITERFAGTGNQPVAGDHDSCRAA